MTVRRAVMALILTCSLLPASRTRVVSQPTEANRNISDHLIVVLRPTGSQDEQLSAVEMLLDQFSERGLLQLNPLGIDGPVPGASAYLGILAAEAKALRLANELTRSPLVLRVEPIAANAFHELLYVDWQGLEAERAECFAVQGRHLRANAQFLAVPGPADRPHFVRKLAEAVVPETEHAAVARCLDPLLQTRAVWSVEQAERACAILDNERELEYLRR